MGMERKLARSLGLALHVRVACTACSCPAEHCIVVLASSCCYAWLYNGDAASGQSSVCEAAQCQVPRVITCAARLISMQTAVNVVGCTPRASYVCPGNHLQVLRAGGRQRLCDVSQFRCQYTIGGLRLHPGHHSFAFVKITCRWCVRAWVSTCPRQQPPSSARRRPMCRGRAAPASAAVRTSCDIKVVHVVVDCESATHCSARRRSSCHGKAGANFSGGDAETASN